MQPRIAVGFVPTLLLLLAACTEPEAHISPLSPTETASAPSPDRAAASLDEETPSFAYAAPDGTIWWVSADGSGNRQILAESLASGPITAFSASGRATWSPDANNIVYIGAASQGPHGPARGESWERDLTSGERTKIDEGVCCLSWSPLGRHLFYDRILESTAIGLSSERVMLEFTGGDAASRAVDLNGVLSPDETRIAYVDTAHPSEGTSVSVRGYPLFIADAGGSNARHLRENANFASWSADGKLLMYWKNERGGSAFHGDVCVINLATDGEVCLREFSSDEGPQWAPDPNRYVFHNYLIDPETSTAIELFERPYAVVAWAPDGGKVAYTVSDYPTTQTKFDLVILDLATGERLTLHTQQVGAHHSERGGYYGSWSADSRYFAFVAIEATDQTAALYVVDAVTGDVKASLPGIAYRSVSMSYSPGSDRLLVWRDPQSESPSIWVARVTAPAS